MINESLSTIMCNKGKCEEEIWGVYFPINILMILLRRIKCTKGNQRK